MDNNFEHMSDSSSKIIEPALSKDAEKYVQFMKLDSGDLVAEIMVKDYGVIRVKLFAKLAPETVTNFVKLADEGYYDDTSFYRVFNDYIVQIYKEEQDSYLPDELSMELYPFRGALCSANMEKPDTNTSSFFIIQTKPSVLEEVTYLLNEGKKMTLKDYLTEYYHVELSDDLIKDYKLLGGAPWLTGRHTVFGQIFEGFDVLDKITGADTDEYGVPFDEIIISSISITKY